MRYFGSVYRPPSEAYSLIVQCTLGCSHNKCAFCIMYRDKRFSIRPQEDVLEDLASARKQYCYVERIFLADGDALILPTAYLLTVLDYIRKTFPECKRVAAYAAVRDIERKSDAELRALHEHGLQILYIGLETGNEEILKRYQKGVTAAQTVAACARAKSAGFTLSVTAISGMGGTEKSEIHAIETAKALSAIKPAYIALLTLRVYTGTPLYDWIKNGELTMLSPIELARETRLLLSQIDAEGSIFRSNHASNYLPLAGTLNRDREALCAQIDRALAGEVRFRSEVELGL